MDKLDSLMELHVQNSKGENIILLLTVDDAQKVINNPQYGQLLADAALAKTTQMPSDTCVSQFSSDIAGNEEEEEIEANDELESTKESGIKWNSAATLLLLHEYSENESLFKSGKRAHRFYWKKIAEDMQSKGYTFSWAHVSSKMDSLKRRYKKIKDASKQSGNGRIPNWEFYEVMEKIFGQRPWVAPLSIASNSGMSTDPDSSSSSVSDMSTYTFEQDKKKSRVEQLADAIYSKVKKDRQERHLEKLKAKEELHKLSEKKKEVRHKEKMAMKVQFMQLLKARLNVIKPAAQSTTSDDIEDSPIVPRGP